MLSGAKPGVAAPIARLGVGGTKAFPFEARGVRIWPGDTIGVASADSGMAMLVGAPGRTSPVLVVGFRSVLLCASSRLISSSMSLENRFRSTHFPRLTVGTLAESPIELSESLAYFSDLHGKPSLCPNQARLRRLLHRSSSSLPA